MELKEFEYLYQMIEQHKTLDETSAELYADLKKSAYRYADMRYQFSEMEREEKRDKDAYRSSMHNRFMDNTRIYLRYLHNNGIEIPDIKQMEEDRKLFGHFACYFIFRVECEQA